MKEYERFKVSSTMQRVSVQTQASDLSPFPTVDSEVVDFAVGAARDAGELTLRWYQQAGLQVQAKGDGSPVTEADLAAETRLRELIAERYPDDSILGEEFDDITGHTGRTWVIDPIDGTKAFTQGVPLFATLLALVDEHGPAAGVIYLPGLDECVWAGRGRGAFWNGEPCRVGGRSSLEGAFICTSGLGYWPEVALDRLRASGARLRTWGDAYGYALVATGRAEAMVDPECFDWDVAPISVIINEAGGTFTDTSGVPDWQRGSAIGSNGAVHQELLACFDDPSGGARDD